MHRKQRIVGDKTCFGLKLCHGRFTEEFYIENRQKFRVLERYLRRFALQAGFYEKYELMQVLGKGTFAQVHMAKREGVEEFFAVKVFNLERCKRNNRIFV